MSPALGGYTMCCLFGLKDCSRLPQTGILNTELCKELRDSGQEQNSPSSLRVNLPTQPVGIFFHFRERDPE